MNEIKKASKLLPEDLIDPLDVYRLPSTNELDGQSFSIRLNDGGTINIQLEEGTARVSISGLPWPESGLGPVDVVKLRENIYFVDIDTEEPATDGLTLVLQKKTGWAIAVHQRREVPEEQWSRGPEVQQDYRIGAIADSNQVGRGPTLTRDLVGARNFLMMGPKNLYEHIYINSQRIFVHHVHTNMAHGKSERHPATYYKLNDGLYLVGFREMDNAAGMITIEDYKSNLMTGKALHPVSLFESRSRPLGGKIIPVAGALTYPEGLEPI